jgi:tetratricopeptide (TPR) repeat protein
MMKALRRARSATLAVARWARRHLKGWIVAAAAANGAIAVLLAVLIPLPNQPAGTVKSLIVTLIIVLALSVVFPVAGQVVDKRDEQANRDHEQREQAALRAQARLEHIDRLLALGSSAGLPQLSEVSNDLLGVTPTRYSMRGTDPYVARPAPDHTIRDLLRQPGPPYPFVVVWGTTKTGKSRTLAEALRATFDRDPAVVLPIDAQSLPELSRLGISRLVDHRPALVVLNDLDPAGLEALTAEALNSVREWAVIAATMTAQRRAEVLTTGGGFGVIARASLASVSGEYELTAESATGEERREAERLYPEERFVGSIAETLVGAQELIARYKASPDTNPAGCALMRAAIDLRRAGITRPVAEAELRRLFPSYLSAIRAGIPPTADHFTNGIEWATKPVASQVALLREASPAKETSGWIVFDHAVTSDDTPGDQHRPIPTQIWGELIDVIPPSDAFAVGVAAYNREDMRAAITAVRKFTTSDYPAVPLAVVALGSLLQEQGDMEGAKEAYRRAIDSGNGEAAPLAALNLGYLLKSLGDVEGSRAEFQNAIDSGHAQYAPQAAIGLGNLLKVQGNVEGATAAYQLAIESGNSDQVPRAEVNMGVLLAEQGDVEGAKRAYRRAIHSGDPDQVPMAEANIGALLASQGEVIAAKAAYRRAILSGHAGHAPRAALGLGTLLRDLGDVNGAKTAYQLAIDSGNTKYAPRAAVDLGNMLTSHEDPEGAKAAYQKAIDSGHADLAPKAAIGLAIVLAKQGNLDEMKAAYQQAINSEHTEAAPIAALGLGYLLARQGDMVRAKAAYQFAIDSGFAAAAEAATRLRRELEGPPQPPSTRLCHLLASKMHRKIRGENDALAIGLRGPGPLRREPVTRHRHRHAGYARGRPRTGEVARRYLTSPRRAPTAEHQSLCVASSYLGSGRAFASMAMVSGCLGRKAARHACWLQHARRGEVALPGLVGVALLPVEQLVGRDTLVQHRHEVATLHGGERRGCAVLLEGVAGSRSC